MENLSISNKTFRTLIGNMGLTNALVIRERVYPHLL